jgi:hypothetical protein
MKARWFFPVMFASGMAIVFLTVVFGPLVVLVVCAAAAIVLGTFRDSDTTTEQEEKL